MKTYYTIIDIWVYCGADEMARLHKHTRAMRLYNHNNILIL